MSVTEKLRPISVEEYIEGEKTSEIRHEYIDGHVHAMVGASETHNLIAGNLYASLHAHLRGNPCQAFVSDMKVRVADAFYYPDVMVPCDKSDAHAYYKTRPKLIIEVLSPATESRDAAEKLVAYQSLESLEEYVLVAQNEPEVRIYRRAEGGWELETCNEGDPIRLTSVGLDLPIEAVFEDVWR